MQMQSVCLGRTFLNEHKLRIGKLTRMKIHTFNVRYSETGQRERESGPLSTLAKTQYTVRVSAGGGIWT